MECVRSSPVPTKNWQQIDIPWMVRPIDDNSILPHSAPSTCGFFTSNCRRAASFPLAHAAPLASALKVRSQSESAGLNKIKVSRLSPMEMQMLELENGVRVHIFSRQQLAHHHSDSDGEESVTSSDSGNTSEDDQHDFATEFVDTLKFEEPPFINNELQHQQPLPRCIMLPISKKKVRFADDCGEALESIRVMTEPSDCPPKINPSVIRRYRKAAKAFALATTEKCGVLSTDEETSDDDEDELYSSKKHASWKIGFTQPASEYVKFRESLEKNKVALENVMLRNDHCKMLGTIKVANISFEKSVFIRFTSDGWKSYLDRPGTYQSSSSKTYDTFAFEIDVPMNEGDITKIEFCICYVAGGIEYWDSNNGKNYTLISETLQPKVIQPQAVSHQRRNSDCDDAYRMNYDNWTRFASWKNLSTEGPYW
jgi:protein phosphatase 1 regulatory subunit 3A/B/C/D/E